MTASQSTPEEGKDAVEPVERIRTIGALAACEHDLHAQGPEALFSTHHAGNVDAEVYVDGGVWVAGESEENALASTGIRFTPEGARRLAALLEDAADELDDTE